MNCPSCGNSETRPSQHSYWSDFFQRLRGREPYRCRKCRLRFYSDESPSQDAGGAKLSPVENRSNREISKARRRRIIRGAIAIAIFAAMFLIFLVLLNYLTSDRGPQREFGRIDSFCSRSLEAIS
jgi:hypothetical protein